MDGFIYLDIFATKGIEYVLVIFALLLFIPFWLLMGKSEDRNNFDLGITMADGGETIKKKEEEENK